MNLSSCYPIFARRIVPVTNATQLPTPQGVLEDVVSTDMHESIDALLLPVIVNNSTAAIAPLTKFHG